MDLRRLLPADRAAEDILAARIRLSVGDERFALPVLPIAEARAWFEDPAFAPVATALRTVADGSDDAEEVLLRLRAVITAQSRPFIAYLRAYDRHGRLPDRRRMERTWTALDLMLACLEVWRASHPESRHAAKVTDDSRSLDERIAAAYELAAAEWGIGPMWLESEMTDEQFLVLMDAVADRHRAAFEEAVEASRLGAIFASGKAGAKAYQTWLRKAKRKASLTGQALEQAIAAFHYTSPEYVVEGTR